MILHQLFQIHRVLLYPNDSLSPLWGKQYRAYENIRTLCFCSTDNFVQHRGQRILHEHERQGLRRSVLTQRQYQGQQG